MGFTVDVPVRKSGGAIFSIALRVYYEDTDSGGVVYYANYLRYLERARTEWLRALGFEHGALAREHGVVFVVRSVELKFLRPARLDDQLEASVRIIRLSRNLIALEQGVARNGAALVRAKVAIACVATQSSGLAPIPEAVRSAMGGSRA